MRRVSLFAATMAVCALIAEPSAGYALSGRGALTCNSWTAARRNPNRLDTGLSEQWVVGFLSSIGLMALGELDPLHERMTNSSTTGLTLIAGTILQRR
jgi:hypothetical protein